jgi:DNA-binding IclR family transcriptional regulator
MLSTLGLTQVDQQVYEVLVEHGPLTAADLRAELDLTPQRLRRVLKRLRDKGMVTRSPGRPERFGAVPPDVALGALFLERESELKRARLFADHLHDRHIESVARRHPAELVEVVHGAEAISRRVEQVMRSARSQVRFIDKPPYAQPPRALHPVERDLLGEGVGFLGIYDHQALKAHDLLADLEAGVTLGEQARVVAEAPMKMILADRHLGLIPLRTDRPAITSAVVVHRSALLDALGALFACLWDQAVPLALPGSPPAGAGALAPEDARLLALLTTGLPDRSIAKQLGLSYRTFQRRLHALMANLDAHTRFQAGLRAAARGWATLPVSHPPTTRKPSDLPHGG